MKLDIQSKVLIIGLLPAMLVATALSIYFTQHQHQELFQQLQHRGESITRQITPASEFGIATRNIAILDNLAQHYSQEEDVAFILVLDNNGNAIVDAGNTMLSAYYSIFEQNNNSDKLVFGEISAILFQADLHGIKAEAAEMFSHEYQSESTTGFTHDHNTSSGKLIVAMSVDRTEHLQSTSMWNSIIVSISFLFFVAPVALRVGQSVTNPIQALLDAVKNIAAGEYSHRVEISSTAEFAELQNGFNQMASAVSSSQHNLKQKINEATEQLQLAMSDLEQHNRDLEIARLNATQANSAKSQFLANMSHELRTPLNAIIGYSEVIMEELEDLKLDSAINNDLAKIRNAGQHLLSLINSVLDLSKIEAGKMDLYLEDFSLNKVIDDVSTTITPLINNNGNTLHINIQQNTGMYADITKLRQILFNLLSNASKFTSHGDIYLDVTEAENNTVEIAVTDSGIGMSKEQQNKLFNPFSQADESTTRKFGGTGLGLTISKRFATMMGGDITVTSEVNRGTTFTLVMPQIVMRAVEDYNHPPEYSNPTTNRIGKLEQTEKDQRTQISTILVIDDDENVHDLMRRFLLKDGFDVLVASNGIEGVHLARQHHPDLITLDIMMPGQDGWETLKKLKLDPDCMNIPVIILSMVPDVRLGYDLGAEECLNKPIEWDNLTKVIKTTVRTRQG